MGNRAVIARNDNLNSPVIYLHWNGGRASVVAFLRVARDLKVGSGEPDTKGMDALAEILAKHFFNTEVGMTVYRMKYDEADTDNYDNGVYFVDKYWEIVDRKYFDGPEEIDLEKTEEIYQSIMKSVKQAKAA